MTHILDCLHPPPLSSEDCAYVFQLLNIGSKDALCFSDTGASGNLVKGEFAETSSFKTIDLEN